MRSFVAVFNEQVRNIEKSKVSIVEVVSCHVTANPTIQDRESDVMYVPRCDARIKM